MTVIRSWASLSESERESVLVANAFLRDRLSERGTIDWALRLGPDRHAERYAINDLLNSRPVPSLKEPFTTAWRLLEESWAYSGADKHPALAVNDVRIRLRDGDRSGALVQEIANLVAPRLEVKPLEDLPWWPVSRLLRPKRFQDLLTARLTSISIHRDFGSRCEDIGLAGVADMAFLTALASALISAVDRGIHIATRLHGEDEDRWGSAGMPVRVYFERVGDGPGRRDKEVDAFNRGIAPSVKCLHAVVLHIAELDTQAAMPFIWRWRSSQSRVYRRLWAAGARDPRLASAGDVGDFLEGLDDRQLWDLGSFPEFAELRAARFGDLDREAQAKIIRRLRRGPGRRFWRRDAEADAVRRHGRHLAAQELKRVEVAGGALPTRVRSWLQDAVAEFPKLGEMTIGDGLRDRPVLRVRLSSTEGTVRFDELDGAARLHQLEASLSGERHHWEDSNAGRARNWLQNPEHALLVVSDLESSSELPDGFPRLLDVFGWFHSPPPRYPEGESSRDAPLEADRVLRLMGALSNATLEAAIGGISHWLYEWSRHAVRSEPGTGVWLRVWPIAVEATNAAKDTKDEGDPGPFSRPPGSEGQPEDVDTLNPPAAKLVRALLTAFSSTEEIHHVFADGSTARQMLDRVMEAPGHSGLIARCLLMEKLPLLLQSNPEWTERSLVGSLSVDDSESILLWRAVASGRIDTHALRVIGEELLKKVRDRRVGEEARERLVRRVVLEVLEAFRDSREAVVPFAELSQMLRFGDEEVRVFTARTMRDFQDMEPERVERWRRAGELFRLAVKRFVLEVWPQERSLATPGVSGEFAALPALAGTAFADAVEAIERFLTPFDCWTMFEYGFHENGDAASENQPHLSEAIDDARKAKALLRLLNLTVGDTQTAVVPDDLGIALERIETVAPNLATDSSFRRLAATARR